jgi:hypothetical protein
MLTSVRMLEGPMAAGGVLIFFNPVKNFVSASSSIIKPESDIRSERRADWAEFSCTNNPHTPFQERIIVMTRRLARKVPQRRISPMPPECAEQSTIGFSDRAPRAR